MSLYTGFPLPTTLCRAVRAYPELSAVLGNSVPDLRGLFLRELRGKYDAAPSDEERAKIQLAARFGLAALDGRDL